MIDTPNCAMQRVSVRALTCRCCGLLMDPLNCRITAYSSENQFDSLLRLLACLLLLWPLMVFTVYSALRLDKLNENCRSLQRGTATLDLEISTFSLRVNFFIKDNLKRTETRDKPRTINLTMEEDRAIEGHNVTMKCTANSNPQPHMYSWFRRQMGQMNEVNSTRAKMSVSNVTRDTSLSCTVHNNMGAGQSDWFQLDVQYAPIILSDSGCQLVGGTLKCVCQAEALPKASINWTIDGNYTLPSSFTVVKSIEKNNTVSEEIVGPVADRQLKVTCTTRNSIGSDQKQLPFLDLPFPSQMSIYNSTEVLLHMDTKDNKASSPLLIRTSGL